MTFSRSRGFVDAGEFQRLSESCVFIPGVGSIGQSLLQNLVRCGVGHFIIADFDTFSSENLTSQVLCTADSLGLSKVSVARDFILAVNGSARVQTYGAEWSEPAALKSILEQSDVVLPGLDTLGAGMLLYRTARQAKVPIVDFYFSPSPNVFVTRPGDPTPEERLNYPSLGVSWEQVDKPDIAQDCLLRLSAYVLGVLSTTKFERVALHKFLNLQLVPTWPPLVSAAAALMADQAISLILERPNVTDYRGFFLDLTEFTSKRAPAEFSAHEQALYERLRKFAAQPADAVPEGWFTAAELL
jgi:molybdopterin/thiamine biosynthesis adenylyltransferase